MAASTPTFALAKGLNGWRAFGLAHHDLRHALSLRLCRLIRSILCSSDVNVSALSSSTREAEERRGLIAYVETSSRLSFEAVA
jgi:hypothetical protein